MTRTPARRPSTASLATALVAAAAAFLPAASSVAAPLGPQSAVAASASSVRVAEPLQVGRYVAIGDSYTAAPLVPQTLPAGGCFRSTNNYPHVVARALGVTDLADVSCSGAQTKDVFTSQLPGVAPQLAAVTPATDLVTIGMGGNDSSVFGTLVGYCPTLRSTDPTGAPCRDAMRADGGGDRLLQAVAVTQERLTTVVRAVRERAPEARILLVGYPQVAPRTGTCPSLLPLADGDLRYSNQVNQRLTDAVRHVAAREHVGYVDVWHASAGHDVCSADPWINGQVTDPSRALNFHPFAVEQAAVADLVVDELR